jgi:hypothetical protein
VIAFNDRAAKTRCRVVSCRRGIARREHEVVELDFLDSRVRGLKLVAEFDNKVISYFQIIEELKTRRIVRSVCR